MFEGPKTSFKFALTLAACIVLRFVQLVPNVEPVMATTLPVSKALGKYAGFAFAFVSIAAIDFAMGKVGLWTAYAALAYGAIGFAASEYFSAAGAKGKISRKHYVGFAIIGTLFYDAVTAFLFGLQFNQPLAITFAGQLPFTAYHLLGNIAFAALLSPAIQAWVFENKALDRAIESAAHGARTIA
ncbi:MAG: hypothetical protein WC792_02020 [Candidatus Micrarchaeia archaeon]|jgi:hypothetical protein